MDLNADIDKMFREWDRALTANGAFFCRYIEESIDSLDSQGVSRTILMQRSVATARDIQVGTLIDVVKTMDGRRTEPMTVETYEPQGDGTVLLRLRGA